MRLRSFAFASSLALALATPSLASAETGPAITGEAIRADIGFLADDLLEGRDAGTRGYDIAARYVAARFETLGLQQAVPNSWYQPVTLAVAQLDKASPPSLTIGDRRFANGEDVAIAAFGRELRQSIGAQAVFVGYGLKSDREKIDDYAGLDLKGKFAVALSGSPIGMPSEIGAHLASEKALAAQQAGAIGLITIPTASYLNRTAWEKLRERAQSPTVSWLDASGQPYVRTPAIRGTGTVTGAAAEALLAGSGKTLAMIRAQAEKKGARPRGFALKPSVRIDRTSTVETAPSRNVLAVLPGSDPALAGEYVLLMAHLDHLGVKESAQGPDKIYNGAMDNASGVATMLAVAKAFAQSGERPKRSILFAAVTAEEDGLLGSQFLAKNPVLPQGAKLVGVVNLDMPILTYDFQDVVAFGAEHSTLGPIVEKAARAEGVSLSPDPLPAEGLFTRSDHYRFVQEGVPAVFLMTGFAGPGREAFEHFLKTDYHQPSDQMSLPFHWEAAAKFAKVNYAIAREIADEPEAPRWYKGDFFGDAFAPGVPKAVKP
ncbi:M28 family metallopeptidase [Sphingobium chungbukense]|uniref:Peptidase M28 n=1 Tax=Sphingobium chungbukense TaxID=56193 RepID=A0A0M3AYA5_9SPHN|nr:M28 family metallopeptidase [Sphingobium chungbukense]KKW93559.1 peptidase M28 [Sphingobium chungbukense]